MRKLVLMILISDAWVGSRAVAGAPIAPQHVAADEGRIRARKSTSRSE